MQREERTGLGVVAAGTCLLLPIVFSPSVYATSWTPKAAVLLVGAAVGLPVLAWLAIRPGPLALAARCAVAFVALSVLSTLLADRPVNAILGLYGSGTGLLFVVALATAWALGAAVPLAERGTVTTALVAAGLVNALVAVTQMTLDLERLDLGLYEGRAYGLLGNPVHLAAFAAGSLALVVGRLRHGPTLPWCPAAGLLAAAVELSGSRAGLLAAAGVVLWGCTQLGRRRAAALVVAVAVGLGGGIALTTATDGTGTSERVASAGGGGGVEGRAANWWSARLAVAERPLLGSGPGTYRHATAEHRPVVVARAFGPDAYYADAHNLVVEYATTTGVLGLAALLGFLVVAVRRARGPLLAFCLAVLAVGMLEPQMVATTPLALLALGAASRHPVELPASRSRSVTTGLAVVAAGVAAAVLLVGDFHLDQARLDFARPHVESAQRVLPWPEPALIAARIDAFDGRPTGDEALLDSARAWRLEAIRRDPSDPVLWLVLADGDVAEGRPASAERAYGEVLVHNPVSTRALNGLAQLALDQGDLETAADAWERSLSVLPGQRGVRRRLADLEPPSGDAPARR